MIRRLMIVALLTIALIGCSGAEALPTSTDEPTTVPPTATTAPTETPDPTATPEPTETPRPEPLFQNVQNSPVIRRAQSGKYIDPGAVVYHEGQFHMFLNRFSAWPGEVDIDYLTSLDGIEWEDEGEGFALRSADVPFTDLAALASSAYVAEDGTWVLYFYTWPESIPFHVPGGVIGRATAPDPTGPWAVDPEPVLAPGEEGAWDAAQVGTPNVIRTDDGFLMYYSGFADRDTVAIGAATSTDGITWEKTGDPVLTTGDDDAWDSWLVYQPNVVYDGEQYVMLYRSRISQRTFRHGLAFSDDGLTWTKFEGNPAFPPGGRATYFTSLVYQDGAYHLFYELASGSTPSTGQSNIYLAQHEGDLR